MSGLSGRTSLRSATRSTVRQSSPAPPLFPAAAPRASPTPGHCAPPPAAYRSRPRPLVTPPTSTASSGRHQHLTQPSASPLPVRLLGACFAATAAAIGRLVPGAASARTPRPCAANGTGPASSRGGSSGSTSSAPGTSSSSSSAATGPTAAATGGTPSVVGGAAGEACPPGNTWAPTVPAVNLAPPAIPAAVPHISASDSAFTLKPIHIALFSLIFIGGAVMATCTLQFTTNMEFGVAVSTVLRRVARSPAFRQLVVIAFAILAVRFGLNSVLQFLSRFSSTPVQWDKTKLYFILREVYQPLELLLCIAALCTIADSFIPSLISVPKTTVTVMVKSILSVSFILSAASVVHNLKGRFFKENAWQSEMKGDVTGQRRWEAYDKLATFLIYAVTFVLGIQAIGLEVTSVLAIGGVGGLAIGLAGREIAENLLNGFLIMSTNPFEVGDEVTFFHTNKQVEGFVIDIGWYRTNIRSFEREVYVIPNAVFSKNILLNVTRKNREFRFHEHVAVRVKDSARINLIIQDIRRIVRSDTRILSKLHRRIFLDKVSPDGLLIYVSFYVEAQNRDQFMAMKQDMLLAFVDCVRQNNAQLATPRRVLDLDPEAIQYVADKLAQRAQGVQAGALSGAAAAWPPADLNGDGGSGRSRGSGPVSTSGRLPDSDSGPYGSGVGPYNYNSGSMQGLRGMVDASASLVSGEWDLRPDARRENMDMDGSRRDGGALLNAVVAAVSSSIKAGGSSGGSSSSSSPDTSYPAAAAAAAGSSSSSSSSGGGVSNAPSGMHFAGNNVVDAPAVLRPASGGGSSGAVAVGSAKPTAPSTTSAKPLAATATATAAAVPLQNRQGGNSWLDATLRKLACAIFEN